MDIRIGNRIYCVFVLILFMWTSCTNSSISEMEELVGIPMKEALNPICDECHWNDFNGNGYKIEVYHISQKYLKRYGSVFKSSGFCEYDPTMWKQSEIYPYIKNSNGLYKIFNKNDEIKYVFLNMSACTIIYFVNIL